MPLVRVLRSRTRWWLRVTGAVVFVFLLVSSAAAAQLPSPAEDATGTDPPAKGPALVINIPSFTLTYLQDGKVVKQYPVAVGKPSAPTPVGSFKIINKVINPTWYPPTGGRPVPPGPANPLGRCWLGFLPSGYGVHGNNSPSSIGKAVSLGCVRMRNEDVEELFPQIPVGTPLTITYETMDVETDPLTGQTCLVFYPDVYRRGTPTLEAVQARLEELGLAESYSPERVRAALAASRRGPSFLSLGMKVRVAGIEKVVETTVVRGETFLAVRPVLAAFGLPIGWDAQRKVVTSGSSVLPVHLQGQQSFARLMDLEERLGIKNAWDEEQKVLELYRWEITVNGAGLRTGVWTEGEQIWLPAGAVAVAIRGQVTWNPERAVVLGPAREEWSAKLRGDAVFVTPETLAAILPVKVAIQADKRLVEVTSDPVPVSQPAEPVPSLAEPEEQPAASAPEEEVQTGTPVTAQEESSPAQPR